MIKKLICGSAGTGKTYTIREQVKANPKFATITATTGIAAVNLSQGLDGDGGVLTINSTLGYGDTESMEEQYASGNLVKRLMQVRENTKNLVIDEVSMMNAKQFNLLNEALKRVNGMATVRKRGPLGLILVGDFCQLPPVTDREIKSLSHPINQYVFQAECFKEYEVEKLTKVWRQTDIQFLEAVNAARAGDGDRSAEILADLGCFTDKYDTQFEGVTILSTNPEVDAFNKVRLMQLLDSGKKKIERESVRWGRLRSEWKNIPPVLELAEGAYVMILVNDVEGGMQYANGSCGYVDRVNDSYVWVRLEMNDKVVRVPKVNRYVYQRNAPEGCEVPTHYSKKEYLEIHAQDWEVDADTAYKDYLHGLTYRYGPRKGEPKRPWYDFELRKWVVGGVTYTPLRLAYASTVHKTQGLTLEHVQIQPYKQFFGSPGMAYVALSRVKDYRNLRIVGSPRLWAERCNIAGEVLGWI